MSQYKLIQDIEAEDHILGPLSLKQFIFLLIAVFLGYLTFVTYTNVKYFAIFFAIPTLFFAFFAFPFGKDQPTEVWALAKLRFLFKPRRRIWDQSGVKELVTITVPKKVERVLTDGLSQNEVRSRLSALANTIDTRGWAVKNVDLNTYNNPNPMLVGAGASDRLIDIASMPQPVPSYDVSPDDDILDESANPVAQQVDSMMQQSAQAHRQQLINQMNSPAPLPAAAPPSFSLPAPVGDASGQADYWFMNNQLAPALQAQPAAPIAGNVATAEEQAIAAYAKAVKHDRAVPTEHMRTIQPGGQTPAPAQPAPAVTAQPDPAILNLANNNDLNVDVLAREAQKAKESEQAPPDEVVISLR